MFSFNPLSQDARDKQSKHSFQGRRQSARGEQTLCNYRMWSYAFDLPMASGDLSRHHLTLALSCLLPCTEKCQVEFALKGRTELLKALEAKK